MRTKQVLLLALLLPVFASAGELNLQQDFGGLDLTVTMEPPGDPQAIRIVNKSPKTVVCRGSFTGADKGRTSEVTIEPGKSATMRVLGTYSGMPRDAQLKCAQKPQKPK